MTPLNQIFNITNAEEFNQQALAVYHHQASHNPVYAKYLSTLNHHVDEAPSLASIPFLPIRFFKSHQVITGDKQYQTIFKSSGTTGTTTSNHYIKDITLYEKSFLESFELFYGNPEQYCILGLFPSYLEREDSSLVFMANRLIKESRHPESGFYLKDIKGLVEIIKKLEKAQQPTILFGVSFALLALAENYTLNLKHTTIIETGGMKGRRKEITRQELHGILTSRLKVKKIHSEYSMTELLSQAYSKGDGRFQTPPWMKILVRDPYDPFSYMPPGKTGGINIIDLANIHSCAFIETQDLGRVYEDGTFEVMGRFDESDIRGCNLLI